MHMLWFCLITWHGGFLKIISGCILIENVLIHKCIVPILFSKSYLTVESYATIILLCVINGPILYEPCAARTRFPTTEGLLHCATDTAMRYVQQGCQRK